MNRFGAKMFTAFFFLAAPGTAAAQNAPLTKLKLAFADAAYEDSLKNAARAAVNINVDIDQQSPDRLERGRPDFAAAFLTTATSCPTPGAKEKSSAAEKSSASAAKEKSPAPAAAEKYAAPCLYETKVDWPGNDPFKAKGLAVLSWLVSYDQNNHPQVAAIVVNVMRYHDDRSVEERMSRFARVLFQNPASQRRGPHDLCKTNWPSATLPETSPRADSLKPGAPLCALLQTLVP